MIPFLFWTCSPGSWDISCSPYLTCYCGKTGPSPFAGCTKLPALFSCKILSYPTSRSLQVCPSNNCWIIHRNYSTIQICHQTEPQSYHFFMCKIYFVLLESAVYQLPKYQLMVEGAVIQWYHGNIFHFVLYRK